MKQPTRRKRAPRTKKQRLQSDWRMKYGQLKAHQVVLLRSAFINLTTSEYLTMKKLIEKVIKEHNKKYREAGLSISETKYT